MLGWLRIDAARASCSNRCKRSGFVEKIAGSTFSATPRPSRTSRAEYTSPIAPRPIIETISYGPTREPAARGMTEGIGLFRRSDATPHVVGDVLQEGHMILRLLLIGR